MRTSSSPALSVLSCSASGLGVGALVLTGEHLLSVADAAPRRAGHPALARVGGRLRRPAALRRVEGAFFLVIFCGYLTAAAGLVAAALGGW